MANDYWLLPSAEPFVVEQQTRKTLADVRTRSLNRSDSTRVKPSRQKVSHALLQATRGGSTYVARTLQLPRTAEDAQTNRDGVV